jgi:membrane associated rhomboid family serine protease
VKAAAPPRSERLARAARLDPMLVTKAIVAINVAVFVYIAYRDGNWAGDGPTSRDLALFGPAVDHGEWWRLFTSSVVHYGFMHILFNMLILWQVGKLLEPAAGHVRFGLLYVVSILGGAAGALLLDPIAFTGGASGGVFGVAGAATLVMHRQGVRFWDTGFGPLLVINLILGFFVPGISMGGHLGGLLAGVLAAEGMLQARRAGQPKFGIPIALFVGAAAFLLAMVAAGSRGLYG